MTDEAIMPDSSADLIKVRDATKTIEFQGRLLAHVTTESPNSPRWTVFDLYQVTDGTHRYVISIIGRSVVYHVHDGDCNTGIPNAMSLLPPDAEPCPRCRPDVGDLDADTVDLEEDYYNVAVCADRAEVELRLRTRHDGTVGTLSRPALRLLQLAASEDPAFDAGATVERL